jgi:hypothetical protein
MPELEQQPLSSDAPIERGEDDRFGRGRIAERIAAEARRAPAESGFVIGLSGPWGSGKTSIANLVVELLEEDNQTVVVRFNPWMFSGAEDLVTRFFEELTPTIGKKNDKLRKVARRIAAYSGALTSAATVIPGVGNTAATVIAAGQQAIAPQLDAPTLEQRQRRLRKALLALDGRIVALLDDLDRLTDTEIHDVVRLVKLVGDLPNLTYILSFDRVRVEEALGAPETDPDRARQRGRAYLEKIVQSRHDVPPLRPVTILRFLGEELASALEPYGERQFHQADWENLVGLALRYLVHTPRDAKRIANAIPAAVELYGDEVATVDLIGLEALRVLEPDVHAGLVDVADVLMGEHTAFSNNEAQRQRDRERIDQLLNKARSPEAARALLRQLFTKAHPALQDVRSMQEDAVERREKRVAISSVFRAYLHATIDEDTLAAVEIERLAALLRDPPALEEALAALSGEFLGDAFGRLLDYKAEFDPAHALEAAQVLLALLPRLPEDESPFRTRNAPVSWRLHWLIGNLLLSEPDDEKRAAMAIALVEEAPDLTTRRQALKWFGTFPEREKRDEEGEMISEEKTKALADDLRKRVAGADAETLAEEAELPALLGLLLQPDRSVGQAEVREKVEDGALMLTLLRHHYREQASQTVGEAAIHRTPTLHWKPLTELLGEEKLRGRIRALAESADTESLDPDTRAALERADSIVRGEVPPNTD